MNFIDTMEWATGSGKHVTSARCACCPKRPAWCVGPDVLGAVEIDVGVPVRGFTDPLLIAWSMSLEPEILHLVMEYENVCRFLLRLEREIAFGIRTRLVACKSKDGLNGTPMPKRRKERHDKTHTHARLRFRALNQPGNSTRAGLSVVWLGETGLGTILG